MNDRPIGEIIRERRQYLGMTQEELAKRLGYKSKSTINKIELGINDVSQKKIVRFAQELQTTVAYLMGWTDSPDKKTEFEYYITNGDDLMYYHDHEFTRKLEEIESEEIAIILKYREADEKIKNAVKVLLDVKEEDYDVDDVYILC